MNRLLVAVVLLLPLLLNPAPASAAWQTLTGKPPRVVANGGTSGVYPDQTILAYIDASNFTIRPIFTCDVQLLPYGSSIAGMCRTGLDLSKSTNVALIYPEKKNTYEVDGQNITGYFAIDFDWSQLFSNCSAVQSFFSRSPAFDGIYPILKPENLGLFDGSQWLNVEHKSFFEDHGYNMTDYMLTTILQFPISFASSTDVKLVKTMFPVGGSVGCKVFLKFLDSSSTESSTGQTYGNILANLSDIATYADGILVPKSYIWPVNLTSYYTNAPTTLVTDAHNANLLVYAYDFQNDEYPNAWNYSLDPVTEALSFIETGNFSVDGLFTDFPTTSSIAIACYASESLANPSGQAVSPKPTIISHNGDSGDYPGCTSVAYLSAIKAGVDYIDCPVQISKDGVLFCRESIDLLDSTNVADVPILFQNYRLSHKGFPDPGVFTYDLTWEQISTQLKSRIASPGLKDSGTIARNEQNDNIYGIITLADFLALAKNHSVGALLDIQNAVYVRENTNLAIVDEVVAALSLAGYNASDKVILQSEDSSALGRFRGLNVTYPLMYRIVSTPEAPVSVSAGNFLEINKYASLVNIPKYLVERNDASGFLSTPTDYIQWAHDANLSAYFSVLRSEFNVFAFDLKDDATLELTSLMANYNIDGFISDFPHVVVRYMNDNHCLVNGTSSSNLNYSIPVVAPGQSQIQLLNGLSPAAAPGPPLVVVEPPLAGVSPISAPSPSPERAAASHLSTCFFFSAALSVILHLLAAL